MCLCDLHPRARVVKLLQGRLVCESPDRYRVDRVDIVAAIGPTFGSTWASVPDELIMKW